MLKFYIKKEKKASQQVAVHCKDGGQGRVWAVAGSSV